ncbi:MAG: glycosyltransferase family 9 protein [Fusobacteriaceae bacterium]
MNYKTLGNLRRVKEWRPKAFKTSHLKSKLSNYIFEKWFQNYKKSFQLKKTDKVLIISQEALGDNIVKTESIKKIAQIYGKNNIYIVCRGKWGDLFKVLGYNVIEYSKSKKIIESVKMKIEFFKKINELCVKKVILFEHLTKGEILSYINCEDTIGLSPVHESEYLKKAIKTDDDKTYTLDRQILLMKELTGKTYKREELRPDIREGFQNRFNMNIITVGIGASNEIKVLPVLKMVQILKMLSKRYPDKAIKLLGAGKKQKKYAQKILELCNVNNIDDCIDKFSLIESISLINDSDFFLGYDSGLSNAAFALRKKYICLFWTDMTVWQHPFNDLKIIKGDKINPENDGYHGCDTFHNEKL